MPRQSFYIRLGTFILSLACLGNACSCAKTPEQAVAEKAVPKLPGPQPGGETLLPTQWSLKPAGTQVPLGDFPVNIALHPRAPFAAVMHSGYGDHEIVIVDLQTEKITCREKIPLGFYGLCFDAEGKRLFASGGEAEFVHQYAFAAGMLSEHKDFSAANPEKNGVVTGMACGRDGKTLFIANAWADHVALLPADDPAKKEFIALESENYPYAVLPSADESKLYVSLWGKSAVAVVDLKTKKVAAIWKTLSHPTEMALAPKHDLLYVACANGNAVAVLKTADGTTLEKIDTALYPNSPNGSTPNSLSLSPDGKVLLAANADNNNIAAIDVSRSGRSKPLGFIPAGWYPTSVRFDRGGEKILVANGKGLTSRNNPQGPNPLARKQPVREYIGELFKGTLSILPSPSPEEMARYTKTAYACSPLRKDFRPAGRPAEPNHPIPAKVGDPSPIKHCIYIIKENRTYDQVFGDMPEGNGDKNLCLFPEKVTPNLHALAREFVLLDNFYVESEVSADGHEWTTAAYATDFVEKSWPLSYRRGSYGTIRYPSEGDFDIAYPSSGYIWDSCKKAGLTYRSYGEFVKNADEKSGDPIETRIEALKGHYDPGFRAWDLDYPDQKRADRFIAELRRMEKEGGFPQFIVMHLPNDHTSGVTLDKPTPTAMVADNDLALGRIVEALSNSKFWKETAVFVVEDDAQNGADHVDAHRTTAFVFGPYVKRKHVDSSMYSTSSMLRTMELILGLPPMTQFDAAALPMYASFQAKPDFTPYKHRPANVDLNQKNKRSDWGILETKKLDFSKPDAADDLLLNEIVWKSVRGADSPMPPPVRACFVRPHEEDEEE
ncbi:MAG: beta-propeller fold lactonase family protein [Pirellulales bacterium]|nr:beta-propeller fold lactonase family protein [Pirellulales bacterium]